MLVASPGVPQPTVVRVLPLVGEVPLSVLGEVVAEKALERTLNPALSYFLLLLLPVPATLPTAGDKCWLLVDATTATAILPNAWFCHCCIHLTQQTAAQQGEDRWPGG